MDGQQSDLPAVAELPVQRAPQEPVSSADVLRSFGLEALVELVEGSAYGICVTGADHRWVYLNPAGCRLVGRSFEQVRGADYLLHFPEHEREALLRLEGEQRAGDTDFYTNTVVRPDGSTVEITWSGSVLHVGDAELAPAVFHPTSVLGRPPRLSGGSLTEVLDDLAREAVAATRGVAAVVLVEDPDDGRLRVAAHDGVPSAVVDVVRTSALRLADLPGGELLTAGRVLLLSDDRTRLAAQPMTARLAALAGGPDWHGSAKVPLHRGGQVVGCLVVLLPPGVTAPSETELVRWSALGAHASVALADEELRRQAARAAAEQERRRLGRDLHDSVSSALFALHTRTQVVDRALAAGDTALLAEAAQDMQALSGQAIAELRAMVSAMREDEPATAGDGAHDLAAAFERLAATTRSRDGLAVRLRLAQPLPPVPPGTAEHLVRITTEAVHNCVKHAGAREVRVELDVRGSELVLVVADEGRGFDACAVAGAGHGQRTMRERAVLCGGWLHVDTAPGRGTRVVARVPLPG
jgi:PAS domain S-box-containing protein